MRRLLCLLAICFGPLTFAKPPASHGASDTARPSERSVLEEGEVYAYGHTCYARGRKGFQTNTYSGNGITQFAARLEALENCNDDGALFCAHHRCD